MEQPQANPPPWLPAVPEGSPPPGPKRRFNWRKLARSPRGAAGLAVLAAALLLWPFSGLSWIPWLAGLGALIILRLLRLDGLLRGWDIPLAGLAVVIGLMWSTSPWAWALAASIGVLLAGLAQLPWWRLAAVGAVLCVVSGVGFGFSLYQSAEDQKRIAVQANDAIRPQIAEQRDDVLMAMLEAVDSRQADPQPLCRILTPEARSQLLASVGGRSCEESVATMHDRLRAVFPNPAGRTQLPKPVAEQGQRRMQIDACSTRWATAAGPPLGKVHIEQSSPTVQTYFVASFSPC